MKAYREYRPTRLSWVGQVPKHWDERRARFLFRAIDERSADGQEELLSVSHITGVTPRSEKNITMFMAESYEGHKLCRPGDLVINSLWAWMAALGVSKHRGIVSSAYHVYRQIDDRNFNPAYMGFLLRLKGYAGEYLCRSKGVWTSRLLLTPSDFFDIPILLPPRFEQDAIVVFLEAKGQEIATFIANKRRMIELLKEQRIALINQAVTRGLNPNAPRKPSGIPWLGEIPKEWTVCQLRRVAKFVQTGSTPTCDNQTFFENGTVDWFTPGDFNSDGLLIDSARKVTTLAVDANEVETFPPGTVMLVGIGATVGKVGLTQSQSASNQQINAIGFDDAVMPQFAVYFLIALQDHIRATALSATLPILNQSLTKALPFLLPGRDEQSCIVSWLDDQSRKIAAAIAAAEREIELMEEYRTALIAATVTGKIDVRNN